MPDPKQGYVSGWVVKEEEGISTVALEAGDEVSRPPSLIQKRQNSLRPYEIDATS